jgi:pimeloyl-ACP methyl ester carboxylesterase
MRNLITGIVGGLLAATTSPSSPAIRQSPQDLLATLQQTYVDLQTAGPLHRNVTETLRFSFVPPLYENGIAHTETSEEISPKPIALYIPGLDGYGISASTHQFSDLSNIFEFWRLTILPEDRSSFGTIVSAIADFVESFPRPVTLIGESCGGLIVAAVAIRLAAPCRSAVPQNRTTHNALQGLVLVNPATSFESTPWDTLVPRLASLDILPTKDPKDTNEASALTPYGVLGSLLLSSVIPDADQTRRMAATIADSLLDSVSTTLPRDLYITLTDAFRNTRQQLPAAVLEHRVSAWLVAGTAVVNARLAAIKVPVLVVAGAQDKLLPSAREASRLQRLLPQTETLIVRDRGHFVLDDTVNLTEAILYSKIDPLSWNATKKKYDPITDWKLPSNLSEFYPSQLQQLRTAFSPVYFSTDEVTGKRWKGLGKVPKSQPGRPLLFVANHQFGTSTRRTLICGSL